MSLVSTATNVVLCFVRCVDNRGLFGNRAFGTSYGRTRSHHACEEINDFWSNRGLGAAVLAVLEVLQLNKSERVVELLKTNSVTVVEIIKGIAGTMREDGMGVDGMGLPSIFVSINTLLPPQP